MSDTYKVMTTLTYHSGLVLLEPTQHLPSTVSVAFPLQSCTYVNPAMGHGYRMYQPTVLLLWFPITLEFPIFASIYIFAICELLGFKSRRGKFVLDIYTPYI